MRGRWFALSLTAMTVVVLRGAAPPAERASAEFVGTMACGDRLRAFVGGLPAAAPCHAITWRLVLDPGAATWSVTARYGVPPPSNPNLMIDGPTVSLTGTLDVRTESYRLTAGPGRAISFARVTDGLIHLLTEAGTLAIGNPGWSYTLNRADLAERPGLPAEAPDMSFAVSPRVSGAAVAGIFEGRTPCVGIAAVLNVTPASGCLKVKWRVTLLRAAGGPDSGRYKIESSLHRDTPREGAWRTVRSGAAIRDAPVYRLDAAATEAPLLLVRADEDVLFFLDQQQRPLVGNSDFSYTLHRVAR